MEGGSGSRGRRMLRDGVRVRHGDITPWPGAAAPVKLLTSVWTGVSGRAEVHQGNETPGFCYGPRCIMGGQKETLSEMEGMEEKTMGNSIP